MGSDVFGEDGKVWKSGPAENVTGGLRAGPHRRARPKVQSIQHMQGLKRDQGMGQRSTDTTWIASK